MLFSISLFSAMRRCTAAGPRAFFVLHSEVFTPRISVSSCRERCSIIVCLRIRFAIYMRSHSLMMSSGSCLILNNSYRNFSILPESYKRSLFCFTELSTPNAGFAAEAGRYDPSRKLMRGSLRKVAFPPPTPLRLLKRL